MARRGSKQFVATAAAEGKEYDLVFPAVATFNAAGTILRYIARDGDRFVRVTQPAG